MKQIKLFLPVVVIALSLMSSCCVQKRHYMGGYHIEWRKHSLALEKNGAKTKPTTYDPVEVVRTSPGEPKFISEINQRTVPETSKITLGSEQSHGERTVQQQKTFH